MHTDLLRILHLEDLPSDAELVFRELKKSNLHFEIKVVDNRIDFVEALNNYAPHLILSDHMLPAFDSLEALKILKEMGLSIPFILITASISEEFAVSVMKMGAWDYMLKDRMSRLGLAIGNALEKYNIECERKKMLNEIIASESLFKKAERLAGFGTWRLDNSTGKVHWSEGNFEVLGLHPASTVPSIESFLNAIHPLDKERIANAINYASYALEAVQADCRLITHDNSIKYIHSEMEIEYNEAGEFVGFNGFNQDITAIKQAELALQQQYDELKLASQKQNVILNALPANIALLDETGNVIEINEAWKEFALAYGLESPYYGLGENYINLYKKTTVLNNGAGEIIAQNVAEILNGKREQFSVEYSCNLYASESWYKLIAANLNLSGAGNGGAVVMHINITDQKKIEALLQKSEANLRTVFDNATIAYVLLDGNMKVVSFNEQAKRYVQLQVNKILKEGTPALDYFIDERKAFVKETITKALVGLPTEYEYNYPLHDGAYRWFNVHYVGITDSDKTNFGVILSFTDINEQKLAALEREKITNDLIQRNKDLQQFAYIVSHNLRSPVANIMGLSDFLSQPDTNIAEQNELVVGIATCAKSLDGIIRDMNQILQIKNQISENKSKVNFAEMVQEIVTSIAYIVEKESAVVNCNFSAVAGVNTIRTYMYSIFYNLISNSIKYRQPKIAPVIQITSHQVGNMVEIRFSDNGLGIDLANKSNQLFGLYKRFHTHIEGKGMGLFMTKTQVEALGGHISIQSAVNVGTTFTLTFEI